MAVIFAPSFLQAEYGAPLNHAFIGYKNLVSSATVTATNSTVGFPADAVKRETTWERYRPGTLPATLNIDFGAIAPLSYIGIGAHTLGSSGNDLLAEYSDNGSVWTEIVTTSPVDDSAILLLFSEAPARYLRLTLTNGAIPAIGVVYAGQSLVMQRAIYGGHSPITMSRTTTFRTNESEKGQWLGRSIVRSGLSASYDWTRLKSDWYRAEFDPFVLAARTKPFFIAWNPLEFPSEVVFAWTGSDIVPTNSGPRDLMSVSMTVSGYAHE
jgi:hypothetical protein